MSADKSYVAGDAYWRYAEPAPRGKKVLLLNPGGVTIVGIWTDEGQNIAWSPLPKRDHAKERELGISDVDYTHPQVTLKGVLKR